MRLYLDMVSTTPPQYRGKDKTLPRWQPHTARIAAMVETPAGEILPPLMIDLIGAADDGDPDWLARYLGVVASDAPALQPANAVRGFIALPAFAGQVPPLIIAHSAPFHEQVLRGLLQDAGVTQAPVDDAEWFDTYRAATDVCRIAPFRTQGGFKPPSLREAARHFAGEDILPDPAVTDWRSVALGRLAALRVVAWGLRGRGMPPPIDLAALRLA